MSTISERIKQLRKSENLTQKDFSKRLLVSQSYLSGLENGNEVPTSKLLKLICLEFGVTESWLIDGKGEMYDVVYENDKSTLVEISNSALLKIMTLLSTHSNVEYGLFANCIEFLANILIQSTVFDENIKLEYLELIQNLLMDLERSLYVASNNTIQSMDPHKKSIIEDIEQLFNCIDKLSTNHPSE